MALALCFIGLSGPLLQFCHLVGCAEAFRLFVNSLAVKAVSLSLMRGVLHNLCTAKYLEVRLTSRCKHQGDKLLLFVCLDHIPLFPVDSVLLGGAEGRSWVDEEEELVQVMAERSGQGQAVICWVAFAAGSHALTACRGH